MLRKTFSLSVMSALVSMSPIQSFADVKVNGYVNIEQGGGIAFPDGILNSAKGITGPIGPQGVSGPKGDTGPTNSLSIGNVLTGAPGTNAVANITGTSPNQTLNLTIPQGQPATITVSSICNAIVSESLPLPDFCVIKMNSGLNTWYTFDATATDLSGNGNNGIVYGATPTVNRFNVANKAFNFDGIGKNYIYGGVRALTVPITVSVWFKSSTINAQWNSIFGWCSEPPVLINGIQIMANGDGKMRTRMGGYPSDIITNKNIDGDNLWHLFTITKDINNLVTVYVDGEYETSRTVNDTIGDAKTLYIGRSFRPDTMAQFFNGIIDDLRIYNRALTSSEIRALFTYQM